MSEKIVSLLPSATEIVCALGLEDRLVGRSHECDFPLTVQSLPACTAARFATDGTSREIDTHVNELVASALSLYSVDAERLARLSPDLIVTQSQCEVCAVSLSDVRTAVSECLGTEAEVVSLDAVDLNGILEDIRTVAEAAGVGSRADSVIDGLRERVDRIRADVQGRPRPRVLAVEWLDPTMSAGNWVPDLIEAAGGECLHACPGEHSGRLGWDEVEALDPDVIVLMPCGFDMKRTREELRALESGGAWNGLRAVREGAVFVTDGNQYFNRPGPRIVDSIEILREIIHPDSGPAPRFRDSGWSPV